MGCSDEQEASGSYPQEAYRASLVPINSCVITGKSLNLFELELLQMLIHWEFKKLTNVCELAPREAV